MKEFGPVYAGGPAGDFSTYVLPDNKGWLVGGHGYGMFTYVHPKELDEDPQSPLVGLLGRDKRDRVGRKPKIIHIHTTLQD